ncbi:gamma-glutamyl-gamma-aminobutyrate hydrolase family protein [Paenarthrobacter sp. NPDC089316]|uniref:gamma-glutamyl-gamma-aminobutyrate hydrolase family protein n=1 Tax=unclassified Paenarthrobacter TaxID=2634190 RepID=UPI00343B320C
MENTDATLQPVIGLTTYLEPAGTEGCGQVDAAFLPETYLAPIISAGGLPVMLPPQPTGPRAVELLVGRLDGLVIPGGWDVDPALYGQAPHEQTDPPHVERDAWEQALILEAIRQDLPLLCICRGEQLLNVTLGGTLHQHLPDVTGHSRYQAGGYTFNTIPVQVRPESVVARLIGQGLKTVPVAHHQAVDELGEGLIASAWSDDAIVEAIEHPASTFTVGVQWHPEELPEETGLFKGFIEAARGKCLSRLVPATDGAQALDPLFPATSESFPSL